MEHVLWIYCQKLQDQRQSNGIKDFLRSERIKVKRRERQKASYTEFVDTRLDSFWPAWVQRVSKQITTEYLLSGLDNNSDPPL